MLTGAELLFIQSFIKQVQHSFILLNSRGRLLFLTFTMFKLLKIVPFLALLSALPVACQTDYKAAAENALTVLQKWYSKDHGTWDGTGFWNSANCLTVIADLALIDADIRSTGDPVFINTLSAAQGQGKKVKKRALSSGGFESEDFTPAKAGRYEKRGNKNFLDSFYDDEGWWALAWMKVFDVTQNTQYLDAAVTIYQDMKGGWPTKCNNGGIWWDKKKTYVSEAPSITSRFDAT